MLIQYTYYEPCSGCSVLWRYRNCLNSLIKDNIISSSSSFKVHIFPYVWVELAMIFLHLPRSNTTLFSISSKSLFTIFPWSSYFPVRDTSISSTNLNTPPSVFLLTWPNHRNLPSHLRQVVHHVTPSISKSPVSDLSISLFLKKLKTHLFHSSFPP